VSVLWSLLAANLIATPAHIEHASPEDCAIIAAVGEAVLGWGKGPAEPVVIDVQDSDTNITYREDCHWRDLGVVAPTVATPHSPSAYTIFRPQLGSGRLTALVTIASELDRKGKFGPAVAMERCNLVKENGRWRVVQ
jgi:hypothetical protein